MIRIGIVGCGRILAAHLRGFRLLREAGFDDFAVTALCARRPADAAMYVQRGAGPPQRPPASDIPGDPLSVGDEYLSDFQPSVDVAIHTNYAEMIAQGPIDAVCDFTSHALHHLVAAEAFRGGKALLSQKPLAATIAAARRMCDEADARRIPFGVFENFRHEPRTRQLGWLVRSGRVGPLKLALLGYVGAWWAPDRIVADTPWRHRKEAGGGITLDLAVHFFNQLRFVAGEPETISAMAGLLEPERRRRDAAGREIERIACDADDTFFAQCRFPSGALASVSASWSGAGGPTTFGDGSVYHTQSARIEGDSVARIGGEKESLAHLYAQHAERETREADFPRGIDNSFALNQHDWLDAIRRGQQPSTSGREGLRDLACAFAILESSHLGREVAVADVLEGTVRGFQAPLDEQLGIPGA